MKKLGIVLSAGGSRGVTHVGFLKALEENGIKPNCMSGCSMGAIVGACYSLGMSCDDMYEQVSSLKFRDLFDFSLNPLAEGALLRAKKLKNKLAEYIPDTTFSQLNLPFCVVATDIGSGKTRVFKDEDKVLESVTASASIPMVFRPAEIDGRRYVDGGIRRKLPISEVRDLGAEVVVVVDALGRVREEDQRYNAITMVLRMFDIADDIITSLSLDKLEPDLYVAPEMGDMSQYRFKGYDVAYQAGYQAGIENVEKIKKLCDM